MSTTLNSSGITARVPWSFENVLDWANASNSSSFSYTKTLTNGTGANQADLIYIRSTTLAAGATLNLDLAGTLLDMYGNTITMARFKVLYFELLTTTTASSVTIGGHATVAVGNWITATPDLDTAQPKIRVRNGGCVLLVAPDATAYAVTATTDDTLTLVNADGANVATYRLVIIGSSV